MKQSNKIDRWFSVSRKTNLFYFANFNIKDTPLGLTLNQNENGHRAQNHILVKDFFEKFGNESDNIMYFFFKSKDVFIKVDREKCVWDSKKITTRDSQPYLKINRNGFFFIYNYENLGLKAGDVFLSKKLKKFKKSTALYVFSSKLSRKEMKKHPIYVYSVRYNLFRNDLNKIVCRLVV